MADNRYIAAAYRLYRVEEGGETLVEEATEESPYAFVSGFGVALEEFESRLVGLAVGGKFDFTLQPGQAYGPVNGEAIMDLDRQMFCINGHFDHENIHKGAYVPMQNQDGHHFTGHVLDITEDTVRMDFNHPLAGKVLRFEGAVVENREATNQDIERQVNMLAGGCGCGCHGGGCGCSDEGCGCGCGDVEDSCGCGCGGSDEGCGCGCKG